MTMYGDGPEGQPDEGVMSLDSLASQLDAEQTPDVPEESEESGESEEVESEESEVEETEDAEGEEQAEEATFTIKVDGKEVTLKQSELIEQAQKGFDYSQKTMALAEERKALEPVRKQVEELRQQQTRATDEAVARAEAFANFIQSQIGDPPPIEWAQKDSAYYLVQKELHENRKGQLAQANQVISNLREEQHRKRQAELNERAETTLKALESTLPGWSDAKLAELSGYLTEKGFNPEVHADAYVSPGLWEMANKAHAYDALLAEKAKLKPVTQLPKVHKPSGNPQPPQLARRQEAIKAHRAKPSIDSLAALL
jgi:hypothetical protein